MGRQRPPAQATGACCACLRWVFCNTLPRSHTSCLTTHRNRAPEPQSCDYKFARFTTPLTAKAFGANPLLAPPSANGTPGRRLLQRLLAALRPVAAAA